MTSILNVPVPNKEPRQKSIDISDLFLTRFTPPWSRPASLPANMWRSWVLNQPVAIVCRETLIANLLSLDWKITPRESKYKEELEPTIRYYTRLLSHGGEYSGLGLDFGGLIEWIVGDLLDIPFGGAAEIGRKGDTENGRVQWIRPIDGGTLFPTLNQEFPIVQYYPSYSTDVVVFRPWEMSRTYMSPHSFILREGWGMAPPEKVYFALDLLTKGDKYYANLLLDIPTAGILDLGDMEKSSAEEWITAFKTFVNDNTTSFKIPVLYEHNNKTEFIPFGKVPNDIMFNHITLKYAALVAAAYGMSLSDIGLGTTSASGETLAGSIRQERRTRKTGHARTKAKVKWFFDQILPDNLEFNWIDYDDELNVAMGRARLASSQAFTTWMNDGVLSPLEVRQQIIQDGLMSVSIPDEIPPEAKPMTPAERTIRYIGKDGGGKPPGTPGNKEPELVGSPKAPSGGGEGDIKRSLDTVSFKPKVRTLNNFVQSLVSSFAPSMIESLSQVSEDEVGVWKSDIVDLILDDTSDMNDILSTALKNKALGTFEFGDVESELASLLGEGYEHLSLKKYADKLKANIKSNVGNFIGRAVLVTTMLSDVESDMLLDDVLAKVTSTLPDYIYALVNMEAKSIVEEIQTTPSLLPEAIRMKSLPKARREEVAPQITVNVPERQTQVNLPEQATPTVNVSVPAAQTQIDVHVPEQDAPIVHVDAPSVTVNNSIPEQEAPIVHVSVPEQKSQAPIVNVQVPQALPSPVNVTVSPTPVEVKNTVNVPPAKDKKITIRKNGNTYTGESESTDS